MYLVSDDTSHTGESREYKRSGLSVSLSGGAVDAAAGIAGTVQHGTEVQDQRLAALYGYETYEQGKKIYDAAQKGKIGKDSLHVNIGIGSSSMKYNARSDSTTARGSQVAARGDVTVKSENDLTVHGSTVAGQNVTLEAGKDISITAAENTVTNRTDSSSHSAGAGVSLSTQGVGVYGYANAGKGKENGTIVAHTGSQVIAGDTLAMESGKDTTITGSKATGGKVEVHTEGDLNIESLQDQNNYVSKTTQTGASAAISGGMTVVSGGTGKQDMHSNYASVTDQAGIYAGKDGYDITVEGNTALKGAVIDSQAPAEKNHLTTGTLSWEDIDNKADYKASGSGVNVAKGFGSDKAGRKMNDQIPLNQQGTVPGLLPTVKGDASSTTKAGISAGTITVTNQKNQKQNIADLNRDTQNSLNKLQEIFDKTKVEERQELISALGQVGNQWIHDYAKEKGWKEGSGEKILLHGALDAMISSLGGGSAWGGAFTGTTTEFVVGYLQRTKGEAWMKAHPDVVQWISTGLGAFIGKATGNGSLGAYQSNAASKWNYLGFEHLDEKDIQNNLKRKDGKPISDDEAGDILKDITDYGKYHDPNGDTYTLTVGSEKTLSDIRQILINDGYTIDSVEQFMVSYQRKTENILEDPVPTLRPTIVDAMKDIGISAGEELGGGLGYGFKFADWSSSIKEAYESKHRGYTMYFLGVNNFLVGPAVNAIALTGLGRYGLFSPLWRPLAAGAISGAVTHGVQKEAEDNIAKAEIKNKYPDSEDQK